MNSENKTPTTKEAVKDQGAISFLNLDDRIANVTCAKNRESLRLVKLSLINAHADILGAANIMEKRLITERDRAESKEYGRVCRILGILEEQIVEISNHLTKNKK